MVEALMHTQLAPITFNENLSPKKSKIRLCLPTQAEKGEQWDEILDVFKTG